MSTKLPPITSTKPIFARLRSLSIDALWVLALFGIISGICLAFSIPWMKLPSPGSRTLARYVPLKDGDAWLINNYNSSSDLDSFTSQNVKLLPAKILVDNLNYHGTYNILQKFILGDESDEIEDAMVVRKLSQNQILQVKSRQLLLDGTNYEASSIYIRNKEGDFLLSDAPTPGGTPIIYDPPILQRPAQMTSGTSWGAQGTTSSGQQYDFQGQTMIAESYSTQFGRTFSDCLLVDLHLTIDEQSHSALHSKEWYCVRVGLTARKLFDTDGKLMSIAEIESSTYLLPTPESDSDLSVKMPPVQLLPDKTFLGTTDPPDIDEWTLTEVNSPSYDELSGLTENTIHPLWVPTHPPILLIARLNGDLTALHAHPTIHQVLWQFHPGGAIFGNPAFDASRGQIYFGTSNKKLIALDARGLFLWSFETGDNIASQPVVAGEAILFGSEDRYVYAVHADTGELIWQMRTQGPVASSPTVVNDLVIIGSDDGTVYALKISSGEEVWKHSTKDAVEAPIIAKNGVIYAASRDANLYALNADSGAEIWKTETTQSLRSAPIFSDNAIIVANEFGMISAFDIVKGKHLWTSDQLAYNAPLLILDDTLLAAGTSGQIHFLTLDGEKKRSPIIAQSVYEEVPTSDFYFGIIEGGNAAWLADFQGRIWRYGPPVER
jgi:outer membrane protein assembly factor BamB